MTRSTISGNSVENVPDVCGKASQAIRPRMVPFHRPELQLSWELSPQREKESAFGTLTERFATLIHLLTDSSGQRRKRLHDKYICTQT